FFYMRKDACVPPPESVPSSNRAPHAETFFERDRVEDLRNLKSWIRERFQPSGQWHEYSGVWDPSAENPEDAHQKLEERLIGRLTKLDDFGDRVNLDLEG